jgi:hypothetical protein
MIDFTSLTRNLVAAVGALFLSTAFIGAAIVPGRSVAPTDVAAAQVQIPVQANA